MPLQVDRDDVGKRLESIERARLTPHGVRIALVRIGAQDQTHESITRGKAAVRWPCPATGFPEDQQKGEPEADEEPLPLLGRVGGLSCEDAPDVNENDGRHHHRQMLDGPEAEDRIAHRGAEVFHRRGRCTGLRTP